ncbi:ATP-dependent Clp protease proteolytic subunit [Verrucomicrobiaceae bacterium 227]
MFKNTLTLAALLTIAVHAEPLAPPVAPAQDQQITEAPAAKPDKKSERKADKKAHKKAAEKPAEEAKAEKPAEKAKPVEDKPAEKPAEKNADPKIEKAQKEQADLAILNALAAEKAKSETNELRSVVAKLKLEKELFDTQLATKGIKASAKDIEELVKHEAEKARLARQAELSKLELDHLTSKLKSIQIKATLASTELEGEIQAIETRKKRDAYADAQPQYLDDPLKPDGTLVISDRRIPFNGPVTSRLADAVTERINYYNNKNPRQPIFIVIDDSPGGSVMAGYRILKAMEGSEAPVYVVVKSFAASMAACITTLAERSFVYPNAVILHHQISQTFMFSSMNLTDQKETYEDLKKWWHRLADPISHKMGITSDEFIEMMYKKTVSGNWTEFGDDAVKLKWADHVVSRVQETSLLKDPSAAKPVATPATPRTSFLGEDDLTPAIDDKGNKFMLLPRRNPKDVYLMYNPDGYYRFK